MTALTAITAGRRRYGDMAGLMEVDVLNAAEIFKDALVCIDANGYAIPATDTAGIYVAGIATEYALGSAVAGAVKCKVKFGVRALFAATGITRAMMGEPMYVVDDNTVDNTSTNGVLAGIMVGPYVDTTHCWVLVAPSFANILSTLTASAAELNDLAGVVDGTVTASKALVVDANKDLASLRDLTLRNLVATGTAAIGGAATITGAATFLRPVHVAQATDTLTNAESGTTFICAVDAVLTLPTAAAAGIGVWYHIVTGVASAGTGLTISPAAADAICYVTSVNDKDLINTPGTDVEGDFVTLVSDGANQWWVAGMGGIWAKEL